MSFVSKISFRIASTFRAEPCIFCTVFAGGHGDPLFSSGAEGSRTLDLCIANAALSQLSYRPRLAENSVRGDFQGFFRGTTRAER
jgi:hypothetical protein